MEGNFFMYVIGTLCYATAIFAMIALFKCIILDEKKSKKLNNQNNNLQL